MSRPRIFKSRASPGNRLFLIILVIIALYAYVSKAVDEGYVVKSVILTVYRDGVTHIEGTFAVDETYPSITVPLLSSSISNIVVLDENQTILDYEVTGAEMTIYTLGATAVIMEYDTATLTFKEAEVWTLSLDNPYNLTVILPEGSTIIYLNRLPDSIDAQNQRILLSLPPGDWEISYVLPIAPSPIFHVSNLTVIPSEVEVSAEVTISAEVTNVGDGGGSYLVVLKINGKAEANRTVTLQPGETATVQFKIKKEKPGVYLSLIHI